MISPLDLASQYKSLAVAFDEGPVTVSIDQYLTGQWTTEADHAIDAAMGDFTTEQKKDKSYELTLTVNGKQVSFRDGKVLRQILHYAYEGKGSPEDCQVAAQLAVLRGRTTRAKLPEYCQKNMGLDCTGFVGNYLWYVVGGNTWPDSMPGGNNGSNSQIDKLLLNETTPLSDADLITPSTTYIFGLLDEHFSIVAQDGARHAHIVISQPNTFTKNSFVFNSFGGFSGGPEDGDGNQVYGHVGLQCVESTKHKGLVDSLYAIVPVIDSKTKTQITIPKHPGFKVFSVFRGSKGEWLNFTIGSI